MSAEPVDSAKEIMDKYLGEQSTEPELSVILAVLAVYRDRCEGFAADRKAVELLRSMDQIS